MRVRKTQKIHQKLSRFFPTNFFPLTTTKNYMCIKFPITYGTTLRDVKKLYRKNHLYKKE